MNTIIKTLIVFITFSTLSTAQNTIAIEDLHFLNNTNWIGQLTYLDYSSGKQTTIPTNLKLVIKKNKITMITEYGNEPEANSKSIIKLKKDSAYFGNEKIEAYTNNGKNDLIIKTTFKGKDNRKLATIFKTYRFSPKALSITKSVLLENTTEKIIRNTYTYTKS